MRRRAFLYGDLGALAGCEDPTANNLPRSTSEAPSWRIASPPSHAPGFGSSANRVAERSGAWHAIAEGALSYFRER